MHSNDRQSETEFGFDTFRENDDLALVYLMKIKDN
jgi:hypothetical protein